MTIDYRDEAERLASAIGVYLARIYVDGDARALETRLREYTAARDREARETAEASARAAQGALFATCGPVVTPSQRQDTSIAAAQSMTQGRLRAVRMHIIHKLHMHGGHTDAELIECTPGGANTVRPRRVELCNDGLAIDTGLRRKTPTGRTAIVWGLTPAGVQLAARLQSSDAPT